MAEARVKCWAPIVIGLAVLGVYLGHVVAYWPQINDDAFITFRYSKFLTLGRGPYFNIGEHVEGYSNFLLMLLMAGAIALFGDNEVLLVAKLIGVGSGLVAIVATWALCGRWLRKVETLAPFADLLAWAGAALVATNCAYAFNSTTGLETTLFSALIMLGLWLLQKASDEQRYRFAGIAFALAALTRPEGGMIFVAALVGRLAAAAWRTKAGRRALVLDALTVGAVVLGHLVLRYALYDGELLPNTFYAKRGGFAWRVTAAEYVLRFGVVLMGAVVPILALFPLLARSRYVRRSTLPAMLVVWASVAVIFVAGAGWMPGYRLLVPYVPAWSALAICGIAAVADRLRSWALPGAVSASLLLVGALFFWQESERAEYYDYGRVRAAGYLAGHAALADWLNKQAQPGATVALMDIGIVGFKCIDLNILDITGLTDRYIAKSPGGLHTKEFDPAYVFNQKPEFLVMVVRGPPGPLENMDTGQLRPWTEVERRLWKTDAFRGHYFDPRPVEPNAPALKRIAALLGARRGFEHYYPNEKYVLLAYAYHGRQ
jgi:arabinofuranosyltransferase